MPSSKAAPVAIEAIARRIRVLRQQKVILDADLAQLYGVTTKRFNEQVRRNQERFPEDFMFQLTAGEWDSSRSQIATLKTGRGQHRKYPPLVFTVHGAIQAANVLNSSRAVEMGVYVVRAFVRMREIIATHKVLAGKLSELEQRIDSQDETIVEILGAIRQLMAPPPTPARRPIGFITPEERKK